MLSTADSLVKHSEKGYLLIIFSLGQTGRWTRGITTNKYLRKRSVTMCAIVEHLSLDRNSSELYNVVRCT